VSSWNDCTADDTSLSKSIVEGCSAVIDQIVEIVENFSMHLASTMNFENDGTVCENLEQSFQETHYPQTYEKAKTMILKPGNKSIPTSIFLMHIFS